MGSILTGANLVGNPSITIKLDEFQSMPFNLAIDGLIYQDQNLLSYALWMEKLIQGVNHD